MDSKTSKLDDKMMQKLTEAVENIVTSGLKQLDETKMKEIKKICRYKDFPFQRLRFVPLRLLFITKYPFFLSLYRISEEYVVETFKFLMHQLGQKHSEIRLTAFKIAKELFSRSHCFRDLVAADFQDFTKLVLDIDPKMPLPLPVHASKELKVLAARTIKEWDHEYGEAYKKLRIGFNYLKKSNLVDFEDAEARTAQERNRARARDAKLNAMKEAKLRDLLEEFNSQESEMVDCVTQMQNGLSLIVPDDFLQDPEEVQEEVGDLRAHGLTNAASFNLTIEVEPIRIRVNSDNREIVQCLQDQYRLLNGRFLPALTKWNISAAKLGAEEQLQKRILDHKTRFEMLAQKYLELDLPRDKLTGDYEQDSSSSSESDLETVAELENSEEDDDFGFPNDFDEPGPSGTQQPAVKKRRTLPESKLPVDIDTYEASQSNLPIPTFSA